MGHEFQISHGSEGGWTVVRVQGEMDLSTVPQIRERVAELIEQDGSRFVVDLLGVTFIDSTGLGVLVGILKRIRAHDGELRLVIANPDVRRIFTITGLHRVFAIYSSLETAQYSR